ncbi:exodeoxyribonuclease VII large subunit [Campylobacter majalis]|uniref:exodeoxyribonuclease VII large subunit n=1 Tax=Campylobacter majalis TaxID=2790656 RepID=UPI003D69E028
MLSVSELNEQAKFLLETHFENIEVVGEISRLTKHNSGHWYFTLKDDKGTISAVMYRMNNAKVKFNISDGTKVVVSGKVSIYSPNGSYQLIVNNMRPDGIGELELAFNELRKKLEAQGLFDTNHKKQLPNLPRKIALITSATSAALADMLRLINERFKLPQIYVYDALTQGENAPNLLINALKRADAHDMDVIVMGRGGGSKEDLWCFNDEALARAIYDAKTPIISAVGHEIDYVISDFVADYRAPTPSAAITTLLPDTNDIFEYLVNQQNELIKSMKNKIYNNQTRLDLLKSKLNPNVIKLRLEAKISSAKILKNELNRAFETKIMKFQTKINEFKIALNSHENFHKNTKNLIQIRQNEKLISLNKLKINDEIELISQDSTKYARIISEKI